MINGGLIDGVGENLLLEGDVHLSKGAPVKFPINLDIYISKKLRHWKHILTGSWQWSNERDLSREPMKVS